MFCVYNLALLGTNATASNLYTIYTSVRHEPVTVLLDFANPKSPAFWIFSCIWVMRARMTSLVTVMLHAVSFDQLMKIVLKEGDRRGSQLSDRHKPATFKHIDSVSKNGHFPLYHSF